MDEASGKDQDKDNIRHFLTSMQFCLRGYRKRKSIASLRSLMDRSEHKDAPRAAISIFDDLGFDSEFLFCNYENLSKVSLPALLFSNENSAFVLEDQNTDGSFVVRLNSDPKNLQVIDQNDFTQFYSGYGVFPRKRTTGENAKRRGHWLWGAFGQSRFTYFQVIIASILVNLLALTTSIFTMTVYDRVIPNAAVESLIALSIGAIFALGFDFVLKNVRAGFIDRASKATDLKVSNTLFSRLLDWKYQHSSASNGAVANIIKEFEILRDFFTSSTLVILVDLPFAFLFIYVIYLIAGPLAIVPLCAVPLVLVAGLIAQPFMAKTSKDVQASGMNKQSVLIETLNGLETVRASGAGSILKSRYLDALLEQSQSSASSKSVGQFLINFAASVQQYAQIGAIFYGVFLIRDGLITQGALIAAIILGGRTLAPLGQLANALTRINAARAAYKSLDQFLKDYHPSQLNENLISKSEFKGEIELKNVNFTYQGAAAPSLSSVNLRIKPGETVGIIGKMGCGKSTLTRLICGVLEPQTGSVLIDDVDVRQIDKDDLIEHLGIMLQESWLYSGTLRDNITLGYGHYSDLDVQTAAEVSGAHSFIVQNPQGYDFPVSEKGAGLSGGQKQSVSLARTLIRNPEILILDEPTSAMDQSSEASVIKALETYLKGKTSILVTHRNTLLSLCDRVIVLEQGRVIADTTPAQLGIKTS